MHIFEEMQSIQREYLHRNKSGQQSLAVNYFPRYESYHLLHKDLACYNRFLALNYIRL